MSHNLISVKVDLVVLNPQEIHQHWLVELQGLFAGSVDEFGFEGGLEAAFGTVSEIPLCVEAIELAFFHPSARFEDIGVVRVDAAEQISGFHLLDQALENTEDLILFLSNDHKYMPKVSFAGSKVLKLPV